MLGALPISTPLEPVCAAFEGDILDGSIFVGRILTTGRKALADLPIRHRRQRCNQTAKRAQLGLDLARLLGAHAQEHLRSRG
jgi:hypothetical protein